MAGKEHIKTSFDQIYELGNFSKNILLEIFGANRADIFKSEFQKDESNNLAASEKKVIQKVLHYGNLTLDDTATLKLYEITLQSNVRIEQSKVGIQQYIRKNLLSGEGALVNFINPDVKNTWRLTLVASDAVLTDKGITNKKLNAKRYTFIVGASEQNKTITDRFAELEKASRIVLYPSENEKNAVSLVNTFSVEKLSTAFFDEYTLHYKKFVEYLENSNFRKSVFSIVYPEKATQKEIDNANKPIRDFAKKMLGRIVFLYFVQKKGWLGATNTDYIDGSDNFIFQLFEKSGANENFYQWLSKLFFETLNEQRNNDDFKMPDNSNVKIPYLNGGLFDPEEYDNKLLTFPPNLFHSDDFEQEPLTEKKYKKKEETHRGFLDFLNSFNFTVHEDSPEDHTVAVDPEMLGHIFENLLEDNKDKGAFYTPKEIVHYMCQESLIEYLNTHLNPQSKSDAKDENGVSIYKKQNTNLILHANQYYEEDYSDIQDFVKNKTTNEFILDRAISVNKYLDNVKICDPAIGSGAFPMGLLQEIFAIKELLAFATNSIWEPAKVKENIIQNSIYGVDIEKGAVDIARLRFWLSLIVNEEKPKALPNLDYKIVVGDSLLSKFGEQVIDIDWDKTGSVGKADEYVKNVQRLLKEVAKKQKDYFNEEGNAKKILATEIRDLKIELLINQLSFNKESYANKNSVKIDNGLGLSAKDIKNNTLILNEIYNFDATIKKLTAIRNDASKPFNHFDWKLDFPEVLNPYLFENKDNVGFDIVIANPPYIGQKENNELFIPIKHTPLGKFHQRRMDYFYFFFHHSLNIAKDMGNINFITTNYYITATSADKLREDFKDRGTLKSLVNFNDLKIFSSALGQHNIITMLSRGKIDSTVKIINCNRKGLTKPILLNSILNHLDEETSYFEIKQNKIYEGDLNYIRLNNENIDSGIDKLLNDFSSNCKTLGSICKITQGIVTGADKLSKNHIEKYNLEGNIGDGIFVLSDEEINDMVLSIDDKKFIKPFYKNSNINKWVTDSFTNEFLLYFTSKNHKKINQIFLNHFKKYKTILINRNTRSGTPNITNEIYDLFVKGLYSISYVMIASAFKKGQYYCISYARDEEYFIEPKIVVPQRSPRNTFGYNENNWFAASDVHFIITDDKSYNIKYILALLNSKLYYSWLYHRGKRKGDNLELVLSPLSNIPIKLADDIKQRIFVIVADYIIFLKQLETKDLNEKLISTYFEQIIDGMVYELYFPELLQQHNRTIIEHLGELPAFTDSMSDNQKLEIINTVFDRLNEKNHPVKINLEKMKEIEEIKIIEGIKE